VSRRRGRVLPTSSRARWAVTAVVLATGVALLGLALAAGGMMGDGGRTQPPAQSPAQAAIGSPVTTLRVQGDQILDQDGAAIRLLGFNVSGTEYACIEDWGIFDAPDGQATRVLASTVDRMAAWTGVNTVRIPLNEQCWLGLGVQRAYGGARYQAAIRDYVQLLRDRGFAVVLDLHRSAPGAARSLLQEQMPDRDHSLDFWREVATAYGNDTGVVFDAFNEPWPYAEPDSPRAWQCWRDGGCELTAQNGGQTYIAAGMNEIIQTIRSTGATNIIAVGGIHWAEMLNRWLEYRPADPLGNLIASFHNYSYNRYCKDADCYDTVLAEVAAAVPLYASEIGPDTGDRVQHIGEECPADSVQGTDFPDRVLDWLDAHDASYTPWAWNAWDDCYALISDGRGTPTEIWGAQVRARLQRQGP
jgi:endoglucanase